MAEKNQELEVEASRALVEPGHPELSVSRQCELLGLARSSFYYKPCGEAAEDLQLKRLIDEQCLKTPFYGSRRTRVVLQGARHEVNRKRVQRLKREMGLGVIYQKPTLSVGAPEHRLYPDLLRGLVTDRLNQVWSTDITYIPMKKGFLYLVTVLYWYSRFVLSWAVSNNLEKSFCLEVLEKALLLGQPMSFNTDHGCQFSSAEFTGRLERAGIRVSMDGRGWPLDNVFVERLWRSVKYEEVYLKDYGAAQEAIRSLGRYFEFYNEQRPHQALESDPGSGLLRGVEDDRESSVGGLWTVPRLWTIQSELPTAAWTTPRAAHSPGSSG